MRKNIILLSALLMVLSCGFVFGEDKKTDTSGPAVSPSPIAPVSPTTPASNVTQPTPTPRTVSPLGEPVTPTVPVTPTIQVKPLPKDGITEKEISDLINKLSYDDPLVMNEARDEIIEIGSPAVPVLIRTLEKAKPDIRYLICEILGEIRDSRSLEVLLKLLQDKDEHTASIASAAARGLRKFADTSVIPDLMKVITSTDIELRYECIKTLGTLRAYQSLPLIRQMITDTVKTSLGYQMNFAVVQTLGKLKDSSSVKYLINLIRNTDIEPATDESFVKCVIKSLEQITNYQAGSFSRTDDKKKELVIKKWEEWWEKNKKDYE